jgi:hypothetical protein
MISRHAQYRMRERGVPPLVVDWLLQFGQMHFDHRGGIIYFFDKHSRRRLEKAVGPRVVSHLSGYLNSYAVSSASDERLVTVGRRYRRLPPD